MANIRLHKMEHASSFRRIAAAAWPGPQDPTIHGRMEVRAERLLAWLTDRSSGSGERLTITHAVARAVARVLARHPDLNGIVRLSSVYQRESVDLFLQVAIPSEDGKLGSADLSGLLIREADRLDVPGIARAIKEKASRIRRGEDAEFQKTKGIMRLIPGFLLRPLLLLIDFLQYELNLSLTFLGLPRDPFGSVLITSVGMMGISVGYAPIFPLAHTPILVLIGAVEDRPVVDGGAVVPGKILTLTGSFDHRFIDGFHASRFAGELKGALESPETLEDP